MDTEWGWGGGRATKRLLGSIRNRLWDNINMNIKNVRNRFIVYRELTSVWSGRNAPFFNIQVLQNIRK